jgi:hypothetical protein
MLLARRIDEDTWYFVDMWYTNLCIHNACPPRPTPNRNDFFEHQRLNDGNGHVCYHVMHATTPMHNICMGQCTDTVA